MTATPMTTERGDEARFLGELGCGLTIDGQHVFCDHPKADHDVRRDPCECHRAFNIARSPAPTPAGEAEKAADELEAVCNTVANDGLGFTLMLKKARESVAALRRALPPRPTGAQKAGCVLGNACRCVSEPQLCSNWQEITHSTGDVEGLVERLRDPRWANYPNTTVGSVQADMEAAAIMIDALNSRSQRLVEALHANMEYTRSLQAILKTRFPNEQVPDAEEALFQKAMLLARAALSTVAGEEKQ